MLTHAALRSLRSRPPPFPATFSPIQLQLRAFAKNNRPRRPNDWKLPPNSPSNYGHGPNAPKIPQYTQTVAEDGKSRSSDGSGKPDYSTAHEQFETAKRGGETTAPSSGILASDPVKPDVSESKTHEEFEPEQNAVPQTPSPSSATDPAYIKKQKEDIQVPLHDLTKGIPSTLDAELAQAAASKENLDVGEPSSGGRGDRQLPASAYITSAQRRQNRNMMYFFVVIGLLAMVSPVYLGRNWESEEEELKHPDAPSGWGIGLWFNRAKARLFNTLDYYSEPAYPRLPDPDPAWARPYTLVMSLEDLLVHSEWTREHGWRTAKRPGVDYFLRYLSQYYELVIFTSVPSQIADPIIRKLDPFRIITWPLFREATLYKKGEYIKDLSQINRPLNSVILLDTDPAHAQLQPENAIILPKWKGDPNDNALVALIPFLEYVAGFGLPDTRAALRSFEGKPIAAEFAAREAVARQRFEAQLAAEQGKRPKRSAVGLFGGALGIKQQDGPDGPSLSEGFERGKMLQDQIRERGQKQYESIEKEIRENGDKYLKELAEEEEKMKAEQMKGMKAGLTGWFGKKEEKEMGG